MRSNWDFSLFSLILSMGAISLLVIFSINKNLAASQLIYWIVGIIILFVFSHLDYRSLKAVSVPFYLVSILSLLLVMVIGEPIRGSVRWIDFGIFNFQPSELAKAAVIISLASFYLEKSAADFKNLFLSFLIVLPPVGIIFLQPDIGSALSFIAVWFAAAFTSGFKVKHFAALSAAGILIIFFSFNLLAPYQEQRIETFLNPTADPLGTGYNIIQSKIAVGSGQFLGRGIGRGSQSQLKFLPAAESDFLFASISEQLGFLGAGILVTIFSAILIKLVRLVKKAEFFGQLIIVQIIALLLFQFTVNIGMNIGIVPITGITLPLVSYGGSSLISTLLLFGIIFSIQKNTSS